MDAKNETEEEGMDEHIVSFDRDDSVMLFYSTDVETGDRILAVAIVR